MIRNIQKKWRLLSGQNNWQNLLYPLDSDLRRYIIHYGAMAQATYDTFNSQKLSKYTGCSRYSKKNLFSKVGLVNGNPYKYEAVKYIYATSKIPVPEAFLLKSTSNEAWLKQSNFIGFVAVATDEGKVALGRRDILVAWRGTVQPIEWINDFEAALVPADEIVGKDYDQNNAKVHEGFLSIYTSFDGQSRLNKTSARDQVLSEVRRQVEQYKNEEISITVTGHSMGGALSVMNAADIVANGFNKPSHHPDKACPVTAFSIACPRVGDYNYRNILQSLDNLHILNIINKPDIVPLLPPLIYVDIGIDLEVDSRESPFVRQSIIDFYNWHDLEGAYLHAVAGKELAEKRGISLVNKHSDALKEEYLIPTYWWAEKNKGMDQNKNGTWVLNDHESDNDDDDTKV